MTRKITSFVAKVVVEGTKDKLKLGNLDAKRDWGFSPEYVEAMWFMLQQDELDDYVIGTGETHTVKEFLEEAFGYVGLDWQEYVETDPLYYRPAEVNYLMAGDSKAKEKLGWETRIGFKELVRIMVDADLERLGFKPPSEKEA